jgi:hypothetical protein
MVKYPEFDKREKFGTSIKGSVPPSNASREHRKTASLKVTR